MGCTVIFQPSGRRGDIEEGKSLLEAARELGVEIESPCGGSKVCGKCKIKVEEGAFEKFGIESKKDNLSPLTEEEREKLSRTELENNYRLSCSALLQGDVLVYIPEESRGAGQIILETGRERDILVDPTVQNYFVEMEPASLQDQTDDLERIRLTLRNKYGINSIQSIDYPVTKELPYIVRAQDWRVTVAAWDSKEIVKVAPGLVEDPWGIAVDVGSTTIAAYLCNLRTGESPVRKSLMNPQLRYGEDIISRVTYSLNEPEGLKNLNKAVIDGVNSLVESLTAEARLKPDDVMDMVVVGNTIMHHLFLGIDPQHVGRVPFVPAFKCSMDFKARDLGIKISQGGYVHWLPLEAGYVGADNVSVLLAEEPYKKDEIVLIIDIGTNGEIVLGNKEKLYSTSCATGPALEGAQIKWGMRAAKGAVEKVHIDPSSKEPQIKIIGQDKWYRKGKDAPLAYGICGSGIIDVIAEMFKSGVIEKSGRFNPDLDNPRVRRGEDGKMEYVLCWAEDTSINKDITVTQSDVRAVQLAKSALYSGAEYLIKKRGVDRLDKIVLAGAFGNYINKESAMVMGMIPDCELEKVEAVGNAAGDGAKLALLNRTKRKEAERVAAEVEYIETAIEPDFQMRFTEAMAFPHEKHEFPNVQQILKRLPGRY